MQEPIESNHEAEATSLPQPKDHSRLVIWLALLLALLCIAEASAWFMHNTWIKRDGRFYVNVNTSLVERRSLDQKGFADSWYTGKLGWNRNLDGGWSNISIGTEGQHWPKHPWLMPVLSTPLFYAFGLSGSLLFNLLMFVAAGLAAMLWLRQVEQPLAAALAVLAFLFATSIRDYSYDYLVDVLLLALFFGSLAAIEHKRAWAAGALFGLCLMLKPTAAIWAPSLALIAWEKRPDWRWWRSVFMGGLSVLALWALANQLMFGRPWWTGYHRILVVEAGTPTVVSLTNLFSTPFWVGFDRLWTGHWGLAHRYALLLFALPGFFPLARRRPKTAIASLLGFAAAQFIFSIYHYDGDRFHWPALALLLPALAESFRMLTLVLTWAGRHLRAISEADRQAMTASLATVVFAAASLAPTFHAGRDLASRLGHTGLLGSGPSLAIQLLSLAAATFFAARLGRRLVHPSLAALFVTGLVLIPASRAELLGSGMALPVAALALAAADGLAHGRRVLALGLTSVACLALWPGLLGEWLPRGKQASATFSELFSAMTRVGPTRSLWPLAILAVAGLPFALRRVPSLILIPLVLLMPAQLSLRAGLASPLLLYALALVALPSMAGLGRTTAWIAARLRGRQALVALAVIMGLLMSSGLIRQVIFHSAEFRLGGERMMRQAKVSLKGVPCDFLAWEHMSWECSHHDDTRWNTMVGLGLPEGIRFKGEQKDMLLIPAGRRGQTRLVNWSALPIEGETLRLLYGVPDGLRGEALLMIRVNGQELARIQVPSTTNGILLQRDLDLSRFAGKPADLEIELSPEGGRHQAAVAIDGHWLP